MLNQNSTLRSTRRARRIVVSTAGLLLSISLNAHAAMQDASADDSSSGIFSTYGFVMLLLVVLAGLIIYKRIRSRKQAEDFEEVEAPSRGRNQQVAKKYPSPAVSANEHSVVENSRDVESAQPWEKSEAETNVYGAYRVDQEVAKLVAGKTHHMDVMSSRAREDRRAIETSLIKVLEAADTSAEGRERARLALEEYGFVARQSATMLMGRDAWERSSAARTLGQIGAKSSLPFLIEALHDGDSVVRNQAVASLGSLKMPAAIGALLDIARRHPDIPPSLLAQSLSECSVESLGFLDAPSEAALLANAGGSGDAAMAEPLMSFEDLPDGSEDSDLADLLSRLENPDAKTRSAAVQELALHPMQRSVAALSKLVLNDPDSAVRSAAVSSLGSIDHESVLAPVIIGLADESRIVRAAAARTLTSLHFDRADAYVRVMETTDPELLRKLAQACVSTGIAAQGVDRLASEDRRQAYEAFSLFSILARANEVEPIFEVVQNHRDEEVRLCAVRVLNVAGQPSMVPRLRELVARDDLSENVRTALLEVLYKYDQDEPLADFMTSDNEPATLHNSP